MIRETETTVLFQCVPLYTLLLALDNPTVPWFILDIEGAEYQVESEEKNQFIRRC